MPKKLLYALLLLSAVFLFSCKKVDIAFGDQFLDNGYTQVISIDSFTTALSTVYVDSFATSGSGALMLGYVNDPVFGKIAASSYFEIIPPTFVATTDSLTGARFDSVALLLQPSSAYVGDTTKPVHITVEKLAQPIVPYDNNLTLLYNTNSFATLSGPIASTDVMVRPNANQTISVRLDDAFGLSLLKKMQDPNDADVQSSAAFLQYLNGLKVSSNSSASLLFNCKDSITVRIYYKKPGLYLTDKTISFTLANNMHQFNHIDVDRSAAVLQNLPSVRQASSASLNNAAYTMYAAGAMVKMRFPSVRDILKFPNYAKVLKATLVVRPLRGSYGSGSYVLPPLMRLSETTQLNGVGSDLVGLNSSGSYETMTGNLVTDELYGESTQYTYDITSYIRGLIADPTINANGLLFLPYGTLSAALGRVIIGDKNNPLGKTELNILYASVQ